MLLKCELVNMFSTTERGSGALTEWESPLLEGPRPSDSGCFVGLLNPSKTCFMNSVLQQLFNLEGIRQAVGKLLYLNLTRPDISFKINLLSRLTPGENQQDKVKQARELINEIKKTKLEIKYGPLGSLDSLYLEIHADASFGNYFNTDA